MMKQKLNGTLSTDLYSKVLSHKSSLELTFHIIYKGFMMSKNTINTNYINFPNFETGKSWVHIGMMGWVVYFYWRVLQVTCGMSICSSVVWWPKFQPIVICNLSKIFEYLRSMAGSYALWMKLKVKMVELNAVDKNEININHIAETIEW